jgi:hypothetical protein
MKIQQKLYAKIYNSKNVWNMQNNNQFSFVRYTGACTQKSFKNIYKYNKKQL